MEHPLRQEPAMTILPRRISPTIVLIALATASLSAPAMAGNFIDPSAIDREVAAFTDVAVGGAGGGAPVDRRLRLAECGKPLALTWHGDRHDTVMVQCPDAGGWHVFVPLRHAAGAMSGVAAVARGEEVTVSITGDGFTVSQSGEALEGGVVGDWIRVSPVKDSKSASEPIRAQILRPGLVAVLLP
jgi:flagellar basal body P-ring formation protein FlgA